ncbi:MAG: quinone oxidoreductase family protein [Betaproteobacteria bacterium]|jgi:NADPH2:quinone reductase|nr:quinone oxidoreductase [Rhodocyclaceae bacterium]MCA3135792.1 quinone oxidoreductase [Rhodocyclaceae bacterium]MCA3141366.1 quinone oxidoreductase [Rhodocyclaceae bacterium]MCA3146663.1 quinone oxidoreductase [Rhodocyclaceae bacterium]MCE2896443.1 quinone oxidoreductase [Betaproteobacteria bacterium]
MAQAVVIEQYGGPEVLKIKEVPVGPPRANEVRLRHTSIGVNFHDVYVRSGLYKTLQLPGIPGIEAAGVVTECGSAVTRWKVGERVAYVTGAYGVYASERVIDAAQLLRIPAGVSDEVAASALLRGLTVEMLLRRVHHLTPGSWILVQAAAGGVGQLLCQWASHMGATVIGTVADDEQDRAAAAAGCHHRIHFKRETVVERVRELTNGKGVSVAYDGVGKDTFAGSLDCLDYCGHLVNFGQSSGSVPPFEVSRLAARSSSLSRPIVFHYVREAAQREEMAANVFRALEQGWLTVKPARTFPLADAAESHRVIEAAGATVPLVLVP